MAQNIKAADRLKAEAMGLAGALGDRALAKVQDRVQGTASRLTGYVDQGAGPGLMAAVTGTKDKARDDQGGDGQPGDSKAQDSKAQDSKAGQGGGKGRNLKVTNIVETIDIGAPIGLVYDQWTQFAEFPSFMKKVENVEQAEEQTLNWKAQVFWSHRTWESTILEQVPEDKIIWRSKGAKGYVDGAVTFHELAPNLTRILVVLEYHPQGFFEHTANIWRAQGRRVRLELKHFRRHVMSEGLLHPDDIKGWRGLIKDGEVVPDEEDSADQDSADEDSADQDSAAEAEHEPEDEYQEDEDSGQDDDSGPARDDRPRRVTRRPRAREGARS